jgi:transposase InsO family protein
MDLYSRKIVSWVLTKDVKAASVLEAITIAKERRNVVEPLIIHSDAGVQFTSEEYRDITEKMTRSYSKKATPWDNACIESFHASIKRR